MTHSSETVDSDTSCFRLAVYALRRGPPDRVIRCCCSTACPARWRAGRSFAGALRGRTVIAFDAPGVGASETPVVPYSMPMLSDVAARVLDAVGIEKADVVGYSHGGAVAQQLAVGHPTRVNRLVLLATACGVGAVPGHPSDVTRILLTPNRGTRWPRPDPLGLLWQILAISTWSSIPVLGCIDAPTLVVCGDHDRAVPPANSGYLRRASATPASSRSRPDTICKSPARRPLWPSWWSSFSIRMTVRTEYELAAGPALKRRPMPPAA